uniref:Uncharacterized protein n=1 Tax=Anguilla anguilla TaxID=7936 RepID=A0A0E9W4Z8_ANGAN
MLENLKISLIFFISMKLCGYSYLLLKKNMASW